MEEAIKKAIEGGWQGAGDFVDDINAGGLREKVARFWMRTMTFLFDPLFWQALGKSLGWQNGLAGIKPDWYVFWHRLIDHLAEGKSADSFFKDLLSPNN